MLLFSCCQPALLSLDLLSYLSRNAGRWLWATPWSFSLRLHAAQTRIKPARRWNGKQSPHALLSFPPPCLLNMCIYPCRSWTNAEFHNDRKESCHAAGCAIKLLKCCILGGKKKYLLLKILGFFSLWQFWPCLAQPSLTSELLEAPLWYVSDTNMNTPNKDCHSLLICLALLLCP